MKKNTLGMLAGTCGNVLFGFSYIFSHRVLGVMKGALAPYDVCEGAEVPLLLALRSVLALVLLAALIPVVRVPVHLKGKPVYKLMLLGLFQPVLYFIGETYGIERTGVVVSGVTVSLLPVCSLVGARIFLGEKTNAKQNICALLSVAAVSVVALLGKTDARKTYFSGVLLLAMAIVAAAAFDVLGREVCEIFNFYERTLGMFFVSSIVLGIYAFCMLKGRWTPVMATLRVPAFYPSFAYLAVGCSVCAFLLTNFSKSVLPVARAAAFSSVITMVATASGYIYEGRFDAVGLICCAIIVCAVFGVQYFADKKGE